MTLERRGNSFVKMLSAPLLAMLAGLILTNTGVTPATSEVYIVVNRVLLPLAVPLLLMQADLKRVMKETRRLLGVFLLGSLCTLLSTMGSFWVLGKGLVGSLGVHDSWKVASALASRHIGGAVNFVGVSTALEVTSDTVVAALAADNLICALYFMAIFFLAKGIGPEAAEGEGEGGPSETERDRRPPRRRGAIDVHEAGLAIGFSAIICLASSFLATHVIRKPGMLVPLATLITVTVATALPKRLETISDAGEGVALLIMQFFFAAVGCGGSVHKVLGKAPLVFLFSFLQVSAHLGLILGIGKFFFKFSTKEILLASNANVGGPTTAAAMCAAKSWRSFYIPALLSGILGYTIATFLCVGLGLGVLKPIALRWAAGGGA